MFQCRHHRMPFAPSTKRSPPLCEPGIQLVVCPISMLAIYTLKFTSLLQSGHVSGGLYAALLDEHDLRLISRANVDDRKFPLNVSTTAKAHGRLSASARAAVCRLDTFRLSFGAKAGNMPAVPLRSQPQSTIAGFPGRVGRAARVPMVCRRLGSSRRAGTLVLGEVAPAGARHVLLGGHELRAFPGRNAAALARPGLGIVFLVPPVRFGRDTVGNAQLNELFAERLHGPARAAFGRLRAALAHPFRGRGADSRRLRDLRVLETAALPRLVRHRRELRAAVLSGRRPPLALAIVLRHRNELVVLFVLERDPANLSSSRIDHCSLASLRRIGDPAREPRSKREPVDSQGASTSRRAGRRRTTASFWKRFSGGPGPARRGAAAAVPSKSNRKIPRDHDNEMYKWRHRIENCFANIREFRAIATRCK